MAGVTDDGPISRLKEESPHPHESSAPQNHAAMPSPHSASPVFSDAFCLINSIIAQTCCFLPTFTNRDKTNRDGRNGARDQRASSQGHPGATQGPRGPPGLPRREGETPLPNQAWSCSRGALTAGPPPPGCPGHSPQPAAPPGGPHAPAPLGSRAPASRAQQPSPSTHQDEATLRCSAAGMGLPAQVPRPPASPSPAVHSPPPASPSPGHPPPGLTLPSGALSPHLTPPGQPPPPHPPQRRTHPPRLTPPGHPPRPHAPQRRTHPPPADAETG